MTGPNQPRHRGDFEIALVCAQQVECDAVEALFDEIYEDATFGKADVDANAYTTARIWNHHVVLAFMPGAGKASSAAVTASLRSSFPRIQLALVVGFCGAVPFKDPLNKKDEILLGDIIISTGMIQIDFGRRYPDTMIRKDNLSDNLGRPNTEIRAFLAKLSGLRSKKRLQQATCLHMEELLNSDDFLASSYPGIYNDKLYDPEYRHKHPDSDPRQVCEQCTGLNDDICDFALQASCAQLQCDESRLVPRTRIARMQAAGISNPPPSVHFGVVGSGDVEIASGVHRDRLALVEKIIAFEKEGAGVWDNIPTIVIKSVSNYADNHKNYGWDEYAAVVAASCMKAFLKEWRVGGNESREVQLGSVQSNQDITEHVLIQLRDMMLALPLLPPKTIDTNQQLDESQLNQMIESLSTPDIPGLAVTDKFLQQAHAKLPRRYAQEGGKFWLHPRFVSWEAQEQPSMIMVKGDFKIRQEVRAFSVDVVQQLRKSKICVAWLLKGIAQDASTGLTVIDVLKEITRQVLRLNVSGHTEKALSIHSAQFRSAETEEQWYDLLASAVVGIVQLYIIIDIEAVDVSSVRGKSTSSWLSPFQSMLDKLASSGSNVRLKVLLLSYGSAFVHEPGLAQFRNKIVFARQLAQTARTRGKRSRLPAVNKRLGRMLG